MSLTHKYRLTEEQKIAAHSLLSGNVSFLTGKPGTGKSHVVRFLVEALKEAKVNTVVLAPTGIAAANIGGQTVHSFFGMRAGDEYVGNDHVSDALAPILRAVEVIIVDEASMVRPDLLDLAHAKFLRDGVDPFEITWIFVGDMAQLKAFSKEEEPYNHAKYKGYDFRSSIIGSRVVEHSLTEIHRQKDLEFLKNLDELRYGTIGGYWDKFVGNFQNEGIYLCRTRLEAQKINKARLDANPNSLYTFDTKYSPGVNKGEFPIPETLHAKTGMQVVHLLNRYPLVNGTRGFLDIREKDGKTDLYLLVGSEEHFISKHEFELYEYYQEKGKIQKRVSGTAVNYPLLQCDAMTIHKSQGSQFDKIFVNARNIPLDLTYVAFSRVTSPEGLTVSF